MKTKKERKIKLNMIIFGLVLVLALVQLLISHRLATAGEEVAALEQKGQELTLVNQRLKQEINQLGSLAKVAALASKLGFAPVGQILHFTPPAPVALGR